MYLSLSIYTCTVYPHQLLQAKDKVAVGRAEAEKLMVTMADFEHALQYDLKPAFGISDEQLDRYVFNGELLSSREGIEMQLADHNFKSSAKTLLAL